MDVTIAKTYLIAVTPDEFRIISRCLRRKSEITDEEWTAAEELQKKMLRLKHTQLQQQLRESQKAIDNIEAAEKEGK